MPVTRHFTIRNRTTHKNNAPVSRSKSVSKDTHKASYSSAPPKMEQLKAKCKQIVYGKPPVKAEGWMLRPDLVFDMYSAKNNYGEGAKTRAGEQAREKEG
ncbi:MAG: hypothetical protein Q9164_004069, partial [Protoblastenia rupestris]